MKNKLWIVLSLSSMMQVYADTDTTLPSLRDLVKSLSQVTSEEQAVQIKKSIRNHPDAHKPLSQITEQQKDADQHDAVYVKYDIFKYLRNVGLNHVISAEERSQLTERYSNIYGSDEFHKKNQPWGYCPEMNAFYVENFWSSRCEINGNQWLSKGKYSPSRYFADNVHQGLFNGRSHQINQDIPFNVDPENNYSVVELLEIAEQSQIQAKQDWIDLSSKVSIVEDNLRCSRCKVLVSDLQKALQINFTGYFNKPLKNTDVTPVDYALDDVKHMRQNIIALALPCLEEPYEIKKERKKQIQEAQVKAEEERKNRSWKQFFCGK